MLTSASLGELYENLLSFPWPIVRYRFEWTVTRAMYLPDYAGSAFRGAFGRALRRTSCMTHMSECQHCPLYRSCPYTMIFETPAPMTHSLQKFSKIPNPYVIEAPDWGRRSYQPGDKLSFSIVLIGKALYHLPLVIYALQKAFLKDVVHGTANLNGVFCFNSQEGEQLIYSPSYSQVLEHSQTLLLSNIFKPMSVAKMRFLTPLRIQENGLALSAERLTTDKILMTLCRRLGLLLELQSHSQFIIPFVELKALAQTCEIEKDLYWQDWVRYSSRQQQKMHLGGVMGSLELSHLPEIFSLFLYIGQWVHFGKNTSFGLGQYVLEK